LNPSDDAEVEAFQEAQWKKHPATGDQQRLSELDILTVAKEAIFDIRDGKPVFHLIIPVVDLDRLHLEIAHVLTKIIDGTTEEEIAKAVRTTLAVAITCDVPVYANTEDVAPELARHFRDLVTHGFALTVEGEEKRLKLADWLVPEVTGVEALVNLKFTAMHTAGELALLRDVVVQELAKRDEAGRLLSRLRLAVSDLKIALKADTANESALQRCLTQNPILFGVELLTDSPHALARWRIRDGLCARASVGNS
jgi:hypothetical protein